MYSTEVRRLIEHYFHHGFQNRVVVDCVNIRQEVTMNPSTLKRRLRDYGLSRRSVDVSDHGYRTVWHSLAKIESSHPCAKRKGCQYSSWAKSSWNKREQSDTEGHGTKSFGWKLKGQITGLRSRQCVKENAGCPRLGRIDRGTENGTLAACTFTSDKKAKVSLISAHFFYHRPGEVRKKFTGAHFLILRTCLLHLWLYCNDKSEADRTLESIFRKIK